MAHIRANGSIEGRLLGLPELQQYLNMGRRTAGELAKEAGAVLKIGGRVLYDRSKIDAYIDQIGEAQRA